MKELNDINSIDEKEAKISKKTLSKAEVIYWLSCIRTRVHSLENSKAFPENSHLGIPRSRKNNVFYLVKRLDKCKP